MKGYAPLCRSFSVLIVLALFVVSPLFSQQLTATLSGDIFDTSGGLVSKAKVTMRNQASGDIRTTVTNSAGHFSITAIPPGTYSIVITATGFKKWQENGVVLNQGDSRVLNGVKLEVGTVSETVEVSAGALSVPISNGEISTTISERTIEDTPLEGRDAGELLKIVPGMAFTNGLTQGSAFTDSVVGTNTGPIGAFSSNGTQPNGAIAFMLDGANLVDPGNMGTQIANINQDMVSQIKVLTNDYDAEYASGPTIFQAYSKSGGTQFHGEGYWYVRDNGLNATDAYLKSTGGTNTPYRYQYAGGNVGGPVLLPFTSFNRDRKKMFFWAGYEYMHQVTPGTSGTGDAFPAFMNVPTAAQLNGDFTNTGVPTGATSLWSYAYGAMYNPPTACGATATSLPQSCWDPNIKGLAKLFEQGGPWAANVTPTAANGWNNYEYNAFVPQNRWEGTGKVDYAFTDNTKLTVSLTRQDETDQHPIGFGGLQRGACPIRRTSSRPRLRLLSCRTSRMSSARRLRTNSCSRSHATSIQTRCRIPPRPAAPVWGSTLRVFLVIRRLKSPISKESGEGRSPISRTSRSITDSAEDRNLEVSRRFLPFTTTSPRFSGRTRSRLECTGIR
ncbi:MAG TPA: carboxypeptidase regulatory-like domain-containing protein [Candidatus Acidoferrum sp.]|nr:carboxypeptidase regulatory-like domain-containing protein [Candidatus Acidoferrum sp.]